jgi:Regulator of chromosome condensation (RCC1) repeat
VDFSIAVKSNGEVFTWGANEEGELGVPLSTEKSPIAVRASAPYGMTAGDDEAFATGSTSAPASGSPVDCGSTAGSMRR